MKTQRMISNISYNSDEHFAKVINSLVQRSIVDWCYWIRHNAEKDELKSHIHFVLKPSTRLDTDDLRKELNEMDLAHPSQPLSCTKKWNPVSSLADWMLYAVHDKNYLASKSQSRTFRYEFEDLKSTDTDALLEDWNSIDRTRFDRLRILVESVEKNIPFAVLVQQGIVPIAQRAQYEHQHNALIELKRNHQSGRYQTHEKTDIDGVLVEE